MPHDSATATSNPAPSSLTPQVVRTRSSVVAELQWRFSGPRFVGSGWQQTGSVSRAPIHILVRLLYSAHITSRLSDSISEMAWRSYTMQIVDDT
jgi:hypothetical protein